MTPDSPQGIARRPSSLRDLIQLHLVVFGWGITAILGKLITLPAAEVTVWRTSMAAVVLALIAMMTGVRLRIPPRQICLFVGTGFLIGWHWWLFFLSARLATASVSLVALPTLMIWCSVLEPLVNGSRRWSRLELITGCIMVTAVGMIYGFEFKHWLGFTVGLASAFLAALFAVINKTLTAKHAPLLICTYQMVGAFIACVMLLPFFGSATSFMPSKMDFVWLLVLSQVCTVGAYLGYLDVLSRMSVFTVNVVYNLEPVYGIILAALVFGERERMSGGFYLGAIIIISIVIFMPWMQRKLSAPTAGLA
jgi:drug/metabolite transporter (DMT)-like permease